MNKNNVIETLLNLKTTRRTEFNTNKIEDETIEQIKKAILHTSNASNRQSYSIIVLNQEKAKELSLPGDKVFIFCIDFLRLQQCAKELDCEFDSQYFMQYTTALIDVSLLVQSTAIAAQSLGIHTLITNEIYHNKLETIFDALKLPNKYVFPMIAVCMGYSDVEKIQKGRIDSDHIFFDNEYKSCTKEEINSIIEEVDSKKNHICIMNSWSEMGFCHYYEWFFKKWSKTVGTKEGSRHLEEALRKHLII